MEAQNFLFSLFCFFFLSFFSGERQVVEGTRLSWTLPQSQSSLASSSPPAPSPSPSSSPSPALSPSPSPSPPVGIKPEKLFVFGDSYADTGNTKIAVTRSWKFPYGITFPGKPTGRFSDGFVSTDFVASFLGMKTPIPYRWRKELSGRVQIGMNIAYAGTGVFNTMVNEPNMTTQIDFLQQLIDDSVYTQEDMNTSVALVSVSGNDYSTYLANNGTASGIPGLTQSIMNQLRVNLKRIHDFGVRKIGVTSLIPLGCVPKNSAPFGFKSCDETKNALVILHNELLGQTVNALNIQSNSTSFFVFDFYNAFVTVFNQSQTPGSSIFENSYEACCFGVSKEFHCGNVDENGEKEYTLCPNPKSRIFWDEVHPSQQGWQAAYLTQTFQDSMKQFW